MERKSVHLKRGGLTEVSSQSDKTPSSKRSEGRGYNKLVSVGVTISD